MTRITYTSSRVIDSDGIADGASIYVYESLSSTPVSLFSDDSFLTPVSNPYTLAAGALVPALYTNHTGDIRVRVVSESGSVISDEDPYLSLVTTAALASTAAGKGVDLVARSAIVVRPQDYGAAGDGATNDTTAFNAMLAAIDGTVIVDLGGQSYLLDADGAASGGVNFAAAGLVIRGGGATLNYTGAGKCFVLDQGGVDGEFLEGMAVSDLVIVGNASATDGFYSRGIVRSNFRNIEVRVVGNKAFNIKHGVSNLYDSLKYSPSAGEAATATWGLYLDENGIGYYTANCTFINAVSEDFAGIGCDLASASGNLFIGGTFEGCTTGLIVEDGCRDNGFLRTWFESNASADAVIGGNGTHFGGCKFLSASSNANVQVGATAAGTSFTAGGYIRWIDLAPGSLATSFHQAGIDENTGGTLAIQGTGPYTRIGCTKIDGNGNSVGLYSDVLGETGAFTPTVNQGGAVTATATAEYSAVGKNVTIMGRCAITAAGSAASIVVEGIPADLKPENLGSGTVLGYFWMLDSGTEAYSGVCYRESDSTFSLRPGVGSPYSFALASGDVIGFTLSYKRAA